MIWHRTLCFVTGFADLFWPAQGIRQRYDLDGEGRLTADGQAVAAESPAGRRLLRDLPDLTTQPPPAAREEEA